MSCQTRQPIQASKTEGKKRTNALSADACPETSLAAYLSRVETDQGRRIQDLITPLAYAKGNGLPRNIWLPVAGALSGRPYADTDIDWILKHCGRFLSEASEDERLVYSLASLGNAIYIHQCNTRSIPETQSVICQTLLDLTPSLDGSARKDWRAADLYVRHHIIEHAAATGGLDVLADDLLYLAIADPPRMIKAMRVVAAKNPSLMVYRLCRQYLRPGRAEDNLSYLQLIAYQSGEAGLGRDVDAEPLQRRWSVCWAHRRYEAPHHVLGRHGEEGSSTLGRTWRVEKGAHSVDVAGLDGLTIAISCGYDGKIRMWDLDETIPFGEPFIFLGDIWSKPMHVAVCRHANRTFLISLTSVGDIFAWEWLGSFEQLGKIGDVLTVDISDQMAVSSTTERSLIAGCGAGLAFYRWDVDGCKGQSTFGLTSPAAAMFGVIAKGEIVIAAGNYKEMAVLRSNGETIWRRDTPWSKHLGLRERVTSVETFSSADGIAIFGTNAGNIMMHYLETGELVSNPIRAHLGGVTCLAVMNQEGASVLLSGGDDSVIRLWNLPDLTPIGGALRGHNGMINALKVWPIGGVPCIISASADATLRVWDIPAGLQATATLQPPEPVVAVTIGEIGGDEAVIALTARGEVQFWATENGSALDGYACNTFTLQFDHPPVNKLAWGLLSAGGRVAIATTFDDIAIWNPATGELTILSSPKELRNRLDWREVTQTWWCVCLGAVRSRLARVAFHEHDHKGFAEVFDLDSGQSLSVPIEARPPLNTLRLGEIRGEPVIVSRNQGGLLFVARISDGSIMGATFSVAEFTFPVVVGELHNKPVVVAAVLGQTDITIISLYSNAPRISIDVGAEVQGLAIGPSGIIVGTTKGLLKLGVSHDAL